MLESFQHYNLTSFRRSLKPSELAIALIIASVQSTSLIQGLKSSVATENPFMQDTVPGRALKCPHPLLINLHKDSSYRCPAFVGNTHGSHPGDHFRESI
jgi:hypothetical protein